MIAGCPLPRRRRELITFSECGEQVGLNLAPEAVPFLIWHRVLNGAQVEPITQVVLSLLYHRSLAFERRPWAC